MKILCLYNNDCALELFKWLEDSGNEIIVESQKITSQFCMENKFDLAVSYTYKYIIKEDVINSLNGNIVNLHNSFLPWNRGADPNLWSIVDGTPRGVSLHFINCELDKGDIIVQKIVPLKENDTLKTSYYDLDKQAKIMFMEAFEFYDYWKEMKKSVCGKGTYHSLKDGIEMKNEIVSYDENVFEFQKRIRKILK